MLIAIDGVDGVGKTTYSNALACFFGCRRVRSWESAKLAAKRGDSSEWSDLERCGIRVNDSVEDLYSLDTIGVLRSNAILDRTITSAIAYNDGIGESEAAHLLGVWHVLISRTPPPHLFVWLHAPWRISKDRTASRGEVWGDVSTVERHDAIQKRYQRLFDAILTDKIDIDTETTSVLDGIQMVLKMVRR